MTRNIALVALEQKFTQDIASDLLLIAEATGNPAVAIEMMLKLYIAPTIRNKIHPEKGLLTVIKFNPFEVNIYYSYNRHKTKSINVLKETKALIDSKDLVITEENYKQYEVSYSRDTIWIDIKLQEMETAETNMSLSSWNALEDAITEIQMS